MSAVMKWKWEKIIRAAQKEILTLRGNFSGDSVAVILYPSALGYLKDPRAKYKHKLVEIEKGKAGEKSYIICLYPNEMAN